MEFILIIENITEQLGISEANIHTRILGNARTVKAFASLEELAELVINVIEQLFSCIKLNLKASEKANLYEIRDYIHKNYNEEIKLNFFSGKYYVSKEYLSKQFKAEFGYGIYEYVLKVRMKKAAEMLMNSDIKILQISDNLGYKDKNYFSKAFKNYFGVYPSEYRNKE
jgi:two-component system response regulator YesN